LPASYVCPFCKRAFEGRSAAREHVRVEHAERVRAVVSGLRERRLEGLRRRNIDPEEWAAGWLLSMHA
jgi:hypothetical protein